MEFFYFEYQRQGFFLQLCMVPFAGMQSTGGEGYQSLCTIWHDMRDHSSHSVYAEALAANLIGRAVL